MNLNNMRELTPQETEMVTGGELNDTPADIHEGSFGGGDAPIESDDIIDGPDIFPGDIR